MMMNEYGEKVYGIWMRQENGARMYRWLEILSAAPEVRHGE